MTLFTRCFPFHVTSKIWDNYLLIGQAFAVRTSLGILHLYQDHLINLEDISEISKFLHKLESEQVRTIQDEKNLEERLFESIKTIPAISTHQILQMIKEKGGDVTANDLQNAEKDTCIVT